MWVKNQNISIHESAFENVFSETVAILSRPQCVKRNWKKWVGIGIGIDEKELELKIFIPKELELIVKELELNCKKGIDPSPAALVPYRCQIICNHHDDPNDFRTLYGSCYATYSTHYSHWINNLL